MLLRFFMYDPVNISHEVFNDLAKTYREPGPQKLPYIFVRKIAELRPQKLKIIVRK
jgi:hypothetical protein